MDMRCGFDRLAERVKSVIGQDPSGNSLFVFRSRRGDRLKILTWDRDGFVLWYKRLEAGVFKLPRLDAGTRSVELRASELAMILDGIDMSKLKRVRRYEGTNGTNKSNMQGVSIESFYIPNPTIQAALQQEDVARRDVVLRPIDAQIRESSLHC
jgi:transposase